MVTRGMIWLITRGFHRSLLYFAALCADVVCAAMYPLSLSIRPPALSHQGIFRVSSSQDALNLLYTSMMQGACAE